METKLITINIGGEISITNPPNNLIIWAKQNLTFVNPEYISALKGGRYFSSKKPKNIAIYTLIMNLLVVPYGCLAQVLDLCKRFDPLIINDCVKEDDTAVFFPRFLGALENYQMSAVKAMVERGSGVLQAPTGSGKTIIGLVVASLLGQRTLWLANRIDLVEQAYKSFMTFFKPMKGEATVFDNEKRDIGNLITFSTVQTFSRFPSEYYKNIFGAVIIDEAQGVVANPSTAQEYASILAKLNIVHKIGLTATPKRSDGLTGTIFAMLGPLAYVVSENEVLGRVCPLEQKLINFDTDYAFYDTHFTDGRLDYSSLLEYLVNDNKRNENIANEVERIIKTHESFHLLVLTKRLEHIRRLKSLLEERGLRVGALGGQGKSNAEVIRNYLYYDVIIATDSKAGVGLDLPALDGLMITVPTHNDILLTQAIGRIRRDYRGKEKAVVYVINDTKIRYANTYALLATRKVASLNRAREKGEEK